MDIYTQLGFYFWNTDEQDVLFSNCGSDFDTTFRLFNDDFTDITNKSTNGCDGDDCSVNGFSCSTQEAFIMEDLDEGLYPLILGAYGTDSGDYAIEVLCGDDVDIINTTSFPWDFNTTDTWDYVTTGDYVWNVTDVYDTIACGEIVNGTLSYGQTAVMNFTNLMEQDVLFTSCESDFDTHMTLWNSTYSDITSKSFAGCDGDDCYLEGYLCQSKETFLMQNLSAGDYYLSLAAIFGQGDYEVEVKCGNISANYTNSTDWGGSDWNMTSGGIMNCGDTLSGTMPPYTKLYFNFNNSEEQDVLFTNCESDFDTKMMLYNANFTDITYLSANGCYGDDCNYTGYSCDFQTETFVMENLTTGEYYVELYPYDGTQVGDYELEVVCGDDIPSETTTTTTTSSPSVPDWIVNVNISGYNATVTFGTIGCGETYTGTLDTYDIVYLSFTLSDKQDVLFTNCDSKFDTKMYLILDGVKITNDSTNECDGDDCTHGSYCDSDLRETFFMEDLDADQYWLEVTAYSVTGEVPTGGKYEVEVSCENDDDWSDVLDAVDAAVPLTIMVSALVGAASLLI